MKFAELLVLQLIRGQYNMIIGQLELSLFQQGIEEFVWLYNVKIIALFDSSFPRIWHHYRLLTPILFIAVID